MPVIPRYCQSCDNNPFDLFASEEWCLWCKEGRVWIGLPLVVLSLIILIIGCWWDPRDASGEQIWTRSGVTAVAFWTALPGVVWLTLNAHFSSPCKLEAHVDD